MKLRLTKLADLRKVAGRQRFSKGLSSPTLRGLRSTWRYYRVYRLLRTSKMFDSEWYRRQYTDVRIANYDPLRHYIKYGAKEGRNPSDAFDTLFYLESYHDVASSDINPLYHFIVFGRKEGRLPRPPIDSPVTERRSVMEGEARLLQSVARRISDIDAYRREIERYLAQRSACPLPLFNGKKVVIYTAISKNYDSIKLPERLDGRLDYVLFSDGPAHETGVWQVRPIPYIDSDPARTCRYVKTHPHHLLSNYEIAVWMDSSIMITGDIAPILERFLNANACVGGVRHPFRNSIYEEIAACEAAGRDVSAVMKEQVELYRSEGFVHNDLIESGLMAFDLTKDKTIKMLSVWWSQIDAYSKRDQLSVNYALWRADLDWVPLLEEPFSIRSHPCLGFSLHDSARGPADALLKALESPLVDPYSRSDAPTTRGTETAPRSYTVDIVVCVHNALRDVQQCLESVLEAGFLPTHRLILIDDGSEAETANFLKRFSETQERTVLHRNSVAVGYTKAANIGLQLSSADFVILLNSDTIVSRNWSEKMARLVFNTPGAGVVGPLSNAASHQSIPDSRGTADQTAINELPAHISVNEVNRFCETMAGQNVGVNVPLVHGFCLGLTRDVIKTVGFFDEENFPRGYGEENDYCFQATDAGFTLLVARDTYVFHSKSKSFESVERVKLMQEGSRTLSRLHGRHRVHRSIATMEKNPLLVQIRNQAAILFSERGYRRNRLLVWPCLTEKEEPVGSAYVRLLGPLRHAGTVCGVNVSSHISLNYPSPGVADIVCFHRHMPGVAIDQLRSWAKRWRSCGGKLVYDLDDDLFDPQALSIRSQLSRRQAISIRDRVCRFASEADIITVSTRQLEAVVQGLFPDKCVKLIENYLDEEVWNLAKEAPADQKLSADDVVRIGYFGTASHSKDLEVVKEALCRLKDEFADAIEIEIIGAMSSGSADFGNVIALPKDNRYPNFVAWLSKRARWDIGIIPLADDKFNRSKSHLKFLEFSALQATIVCSNVSSYSKIAKHRENALVVENETDAWLSGLRELVVDAGLRRQLASNAYKDLEERFTLSANDDLYKEFMNYLISDIAFQVSTCLTANVK